MLSSMKWQDWANFLLGVWLASSPWTLGYVEHGLATLPCVVLTAQETEAIRWKRYRYR